MTDRPWHRIFAPILTSFFRWLLLSYHARHERPPKPMNLKRILAAALSDAAE